MPILAWLGVYTVFGLITEAVRAEALKKHGMTLKEYYARKARGEKVPDL